jgi:hypothetical protein
VAGGTTVTITGTGFADQGATISNVTDVQVGGVSLSQITITPTEIQGITGAVTAPGAADVVVFTINGNATLPGGFTYTQAAPQPTPSSSPAPTTPSITYTNTVAQIIANNNCTQCHNQQQASFNGNFDASSYTSIMNASPQVVVPGNSANSVLFQKISPGGSMSNRINPSDVTTIQQWIDSGAAQ